MDDGKKRKSEVSAGEGVAKKFKVPRHNFDVKMPVMPRSRVTQSYRDRLC